MGSGSELALAGACHGRGGTVGCASQPPARVERRRRGSRLSPGALLSVQGPPRTGNIGQLTFSAASFASRARAAAARASSRAAIAFCSRCHRDAAPTTAPAAASAPATHGSDDEVPPSWLIARAGADYGAL